MAQRIYELGNDRKGSPILTKADVMKVCCIGHINSILEEKIHAIVEQESNPLVTVRVIVEDPA